LSRSERTDITIHIIPFLFCLLSPDGGLIRQLDYRNPSTQSIGC
jgi:hypothetical protein